MKNGKIVNRKESTMTNEQVNDAIRKNAENGFVLSREELAEKYGITHTAVRCREQRMKLRRGLKSYVAQEKDIPTAIEEDKRLKQLREAKGSVQKKYEYVLAENETLQKQIDAVTMMKEGAKHFKIPKFSSKGHGQATAIALASDWHIEEEVRPDTVSAMNFYNLEESKRRAEKFFKTLVYLVELEQKNTHIDHLVLGLLGDFISGDIHLDIGKSALLEPSHAIVRCQEYLISGIKHILEHSTLRITAVCHTGNHGRKDKEQMIANESGNSLEYLMYHMLANYFRDEPRVTFVIPEGYHSYMDVYGVVVRFHHGHHFRYNGGVGGPSISINKKIAQWNKVQDARGAPFFEVIKNSIQEFNIARPADIDCFGHFHQFLDGGNFIMNGSMIGYNPYAISIGAGYEPPKQALFFIHSKYGHYDTRRILFLNE